MRTFTERASLLQKVRRALRKKYGKPTMELADGVHEQLLRIVLAEETAVRVVDDVMKRLDETFVDLNELRVSLSSEIADAFGDIPDAHGKAVRLTKLFNEIFLKHNTMDWGFFQSMGVRELRQYFEKINGGGPELAAAAVMFLSSGHAVPAGSDVRRVLQRLELADAEETVQVVQGFLERAVTRDQGFEIWALLRRVAEAVCSVKAPACGRCPLKPMCVTGQARLAAKRTRAKAKAKAKTTKSTKKTAKKKKPGKTVKKATKKSATRKTAKKAAKKTTAKKSAKKPAKKAAKKKVAKKATRKRS
jgi:endonuclease III